MTTQASDRELLNITRGDVLFILGTIQRFPNGGSRTDLAFELIDSLSMRWSVGEYENDKTSP